MTPNFYIKPEKIDGDFALIEGAEAKHARSVLRLKKNDPVTIVDGCGNGYRCEIIDLSAKAIKCSIIAKVRHYGEPHYQVTLAAGLSTGFKFDEVIQRGTELGIVRFIPLLTEKSKIKIDDPTRWKKKLTRWNKVAVASMKQTGRSKLPEISEPVSFLDYLKADADESIKLFFDPNHAQMSLNDVKATDEILDYSIIIGPESGFSRDEIKEIEEIKSQNKENIHIVSLGKRILRTENASPAAIAALMFLLGELR